MPPILHTYLKPLMHYVCIAVLIVVGYFVAAGLIDKFHTSPVPQTVSVQPGPTTAVGKAAETLAQAMTNSALAAALHGENVQLSEAQQTVANAISSYSGIGSRMAGAAAAGLTQGPPQQEVVTVHTTSGKTASFTPPTPGPSDDQIQRDMKSVLKDTTVNANVKDDVTISWQDKPFSPISAAYASDGASGIAWRVHSAPFLSVNALGLVNHGGLEPGVDVEHILKGTSLGIGVGATYNLATHRADPVAVVQIHF